MENRETVQRVVQAHAGWVFAAARWRVGDAALAEDVAQGVFVLYWQKGVGRVQGEGKVAGWLHRAVRYCSANALRLERLRQRHEREAAMAKKQGKRMADWTEVEGELEGAMDKLSERDREVVLLRFYRGLSLQEVGRALGLSEDAAQKRVERAVGKLRGVLRKKGVRGTTAGLSAVLAGNVVGEVPASLVQGIMKAVGGGGTSATASAIAKGAMKMMAMAKVKVKVAVVSVIMMAGVGAGVVGMGGGAATATAPVSRAQTRAAGSSLIRTADVGKPLNEVYALADDEVVCFIPPPYPQGRQTHLDRAWGGRAPEGVTAQLIFHADRFDHPWSTSAAAGTLVSAIADCGDLTRAEMDIPRDVGLLVVDGDWVVKTGAPRGQRMAAVQSILREYLRRPITITKTTMTRPAISVSGSYDFRGNDTGDRLGRIRVYPDSLSIPIPDNTAGGSGTLKEFFRRIEDITQWRVIDKTDGASHEVAWLEDICRVDFAKPEQIRLFLDHLAEQTSLQFTLTTADVEVHVLREEGTEPATRP